MATIMPLPETLRSKVSSGVILCNMTRVVEELVFNSLDAGATKVSVFLGVGTCFVKVVDDGSGISRDGLKLLGERYVTSKLHPLADFDATNEIYGFRGEALASISDVSLLEIITKAHGMPNGYRKVMKGSTCFSFGIDDDRKNVGTTVVVRDLFYNLPVRRNYMQSSPQKVLHSVKKCILGIALVHSMVSFKVVDIESEDELLSTHSSSTPLSLLMSGFGIKDSSFLHELNANDGVLRLSGYISCSCDSFPTKPFQYIYINSRFVCKGPIHKLLNHLAAGFGCLCCDSWKANLGLKKRKRSGSQPYSVYIVNLCCPRSLYDLTFEASKTYVLFKDWEPVLTFIQKAIHTVWMKKKVYEESFCYKANILGKEEMWKKYDDMISSEAEDTKLALESRWFQHHQASLHHPSSPLEKLTKESSHIVHVEHERSTFWEFQNDIAGPEEENTKMEYVYQADYPFQLSDAFAEFSWKNDGHLWISDTNFSTKESCFLDNSFLAAGRSSTTVDGNFLSLQCGKECLKNESLLSNGLAGSTFSFDRDEFSKELHISKDAKKPFPKTWFSQGSLPFGRALFAGEEGFDFPTSFKNKQKMLCCDERDDIIDVDVNIRSFDLYPRTLTLLPNDEFCAQNLPRDSIKGDMLTALNHPSKASLKSFPPYAESSTEETIFLSDSNTLLRSCASGHQSIIPEWCSVFSEPFHQAAYWDVGHIQKKAFDGTDYWQLKDIEENCQFGYDFCGKNFGSFESQREPFRNKICAPNSVSKEKSNRSHSAPPFYRHKRRFISLNHCSTTQAGELDANTLHNVNISPESGMLKCLQQPFGVCHLNSKSSSEEDLLFGTRRGIMKSDSRLDLNTTSKGEIFQQAECPQAHHAAHVEDSISEEIQGSIDSGTKWLNSYPVNTSNKESCDFGGQDGILDISSGLLHLASDSLVPKSISKNCLEEAKVLQQVDKKFIPVVAGGTLALIDQHAADERIRLEELRQKVLYGEGKALTYLDSEEELILPEFMYQLLYNYAEEVKDWGWICNIHTQRSSSFKKNVNLLYHQRTVVTLLAVPCILGVNLSDEDLLDFLQQLAITDGSSTIPPAVLRVLNSKACRGAIMFGDSLLHSESSLIVEELKQTSLCFQCAHGRPTTVPIVNLEALKRQMPQLGILNDNSVETSWHGLRKHDNSLQRASQRLDAAKGEC